MDGDDLLRWHIEALGVLARTDQPNRVHLIERNIEDYVRAEPGSERSSLEHLRGAIDRNEAEKRSRLRIGA